MLLVVGKAAAGHHSAAVVPDIGPNFSSLVRRNSYTVLPSLLRTRHELFVLLLLDMFPVAAGIAERVGGAAALFKIIVSSFLDICLFTHLLCIFLPIEPSYSNLWLC